MFPHLPERVFPVATTHVGFSGSAGNSAVGNAYPRSPVEPSRSYLPALCHPPDGFGARFSRSDPERASSKRMISTNQKYELGLAVRDGEPYRRFGLGPAGLRGPPSMFAPGILTAGVQRRLLNGAGDVCAAVAVVGVGFRGTEVDGGAEDARADLAVGPPLGARSPTRAATHELTMLVPVL